ncbi:hypothetical protein THMIRHAS_06480 [Thiosulfatimonas sediminis]|uniref:Acyltransferase n=1 Tax=Thiosulfatimonas sediminis TaxID=2675054 RepID=A0A6F8PT32_9GAMM|nr:acyltransferase family protein [Thiosulfatimonas sediminis]BBP45275.1 hypothetical protein THMIRHAS_06480 [Thiosulfatimonas sediminis]
MSLHLPSPVKFREDINGLRAWAVIAVLLFHFQLIGLPGGFVGVDIFFVISGYLMTAIIVGGYEKGNFSILKFYMARVRRILPALLVLIFVLLVIGWFWLYTSDYQELGAQSLYGMSFLSNLYYWRTAGYFGADAEEKWLLHIWSLAVEAQFYVLYPLFIAIIWKFWRSVKVVLVWVMLLFTISLFTNIILVEKMPSAVFYLLPTRGWELAAGAIVFLITKMHRFNHSNLKTFYWFGWLLIGVSFFLINESMPWPGYWAVIPVLGTSLIIFANNQGGALTANPVAQWLGDRSYSLYLWHWPLVVALYFASLQNSWFWVISFFTLSFLLAHISYQLIEKPTRGYLSKSTFRKEFLVIVLITALLSLFAWTIKEKSFSGRFESVIETEIENITNNKQLMMPSVENGYCFYNYQDNTKLEFGGNNLNCSVGSQNEKSKKTLLFGDSYAGHYDPFWDVIGKELDLNIHSVSSNWCFPSTEESFTGRIPSRAFSQCLFIRQWLSEQINNTDILILSADYVDVANKGYLNEIFRLAELFAKNGTKVVIMPSPKIYDQNILKQFIRGKVFYEKPSEQVVFSKKDQSAIEINKKLSHLAKGNNNIFFIERSMLFNGKDFANEELPFSYDGGHISIYGAIKASEIFKANDGIKKLELFLGFTE